VVEKQSLGYDFTYYEMPFNTDHAVVVFSAGPSIVGGSCRVLVETQEAADGADAMELSQGLPEPLLCQCRAYLASCRDLDVEFSEAVAQVGHTPC